MMLRRKRVLAAKIESTIGTAETLAAADAAMNIYNPIIQATIDMEARQGQGGFGMFSSVPGGRIGVATFRTYLEWDGTVTEPSWADTFLPACGYVKTGQVYTPRTEAPGTNVKTLTIGVYQDNGAVPRMGSIWSGAPEPGGASGMPLSPSSQSRHAGHHDPGCGVWRASQASGSM